jgi:BirA family biotin operon repressor/biotin-[acetyl-CoA-carboxylase] ligase
MHHVHRYETLSSTMHKAAELAAAGCPSGTVIVAEEQTAGHGRYGRTWHSEKGAGLYMSEVLRLKICTDSLPVVTLCLGLAASEAIQSVAGIACDLRWPNDVLADGRKCAGILVQIHEQTLVVGIGINVNQTEFPQEIENLATSLRLASGREHSREQLLEKLIAGIDSHTEMLMANGKEPVLRAFAASSSYVLGRHVLVDQGDSIIEGITDGLDAQGFLLLRQQDGRRTRVVAGGVRPACS